MNPDEKECPDCAEVVKAKARKCKHCGYEFAPASVPESATATPLLPPRLEPGDIMDLLSHLVDKNLVVYEEDQNGQGRYRLLETVRQYSRDKLLDSGEDEALRERHCDFFLSVAEQARPELFGQEQVVWLDRLEAEHENLRTALEWCHHNRESAEAGLRLSAALWRFWWDHAHLAEGRRWYWVALHHVKAAERTPARAAALNGAGIMAGLLGDSSGAQECYAESLALYQEFGDEHGIATTKGRLGEAAMARADYAAARRLLEEALEMHRRLGNLWEVGQTLCCLGIVAQQDGRLDQAEDLYEESFSVWRGLGDRRYTHALNNLGWVAVRRGDPAAARARFEAALKVQQEWGDRWVIPWTLVGLGVAAAEASDDARSRTLLAEGIRRGHEMWARNVVAAGIEGIADLAVRKGHVERAARLYGAAAILDESIPQPPDAPTSRGKRSAVRSVLGEEAFAAAYAAGRAMTLEQAVAYALEETEGGTAAEDGAA